MQALIVVSRTITANGSSIIESASAPLPDDLTLDPLTEARRRGYVAAMLFQSLPSVTPCPPPKPTHLPN